MMEMQRPTPSVMAALPHWMYAKSANSVACHWAKRCGIPNSGLKELFSHLKSIEICTVVNSKSILNCSLAAFSDPPVACRLEKIKEC